MLSFGNCRVNVWLCLVTCVFVTVPYDIVPYLVDTQVWGLHILFNINDINLKYYLHTQCNE